MRRLPRTPQAIREHLLPEDRPRFEAEWRTAARQAGDVFDLAPINAVINEWWPLAVLSQDPAGLRRMEDTVDRILRGEDVGSRPWEVIAAEHGWPVGE